MSAVAMGARITELRTSMGWSQGMLSRRLRDSGFKTAHQMTVSRIENAERSVTVFEAYVIADTFGITIDQLAGREPFEPIGGAAGLRESIQILTDELNRRSA